MKVVKVSAANSTLSDPGAAVWNGIPGEAVALAPAPVALTRDVSAFLALSADHGRVRAVQVAALHNGEAIALRLSWAVAEPSDAIRDLDQFVDGAAALFPLARDANAMTMGAAGKPTNAWYWKAGKRDPYDVIAEGFGTSDRRAPEATGLSVSAGYAGGRWQVIFRRPLSGAGNSITFVPGKSTAIAFAVWEGRNRDRSGRKSVSGEFMPLHVGT